MIKKSGSLPFTEKYYTFERSTRVNSRGYVEMTTIAIPKKNIPDA